MLFNSGVFLEFFAAFLLLYWLVRKQLTARNLLILAGSYLFYGWWDARFLTLIFISSVLDYTVGLALARPLAPQNRRAWLALSIAGNLGILGFFKYFNFFVGSFAMMLERLGVPFNPLTLGIVLPVGISFYTFQTMSYTIDVYRGEMAPTRNFINFLAYVAFFPQLVAGPIERGKHLLPQFERPLTITRAMVKEGIWLLVWGLFKKVVLADNLAPLVDMVYQNDTFAGPAVLLGTVAFAFQIYCDFSGYSDIARGTARLLGFDIMVNFNIPYAAKNVREFWQRWHISLSTWLRDYLYLSLGGNRRGKARTHLNLLTTMVLGGLWHGAAWNFVLWGVWHGAGLAGHRVLRERRDPALAITKPWWSSVPPWLFTMSFVLYGWLLFRARSMDQIVAMTQALGHWTFPAWIGSLTLNLVAFTLPLILVEVWQFRTGNRLAPLGLSRWSRAILFGVLLLAIVMFWEKEKTPFIYFQF